jgi:hypothetical protein
MENEEKPDLARLISDNQASLELLTKDIADIRRFILWQKRMSVLRLLLIAIPVVLGVIYLPPIISGFFDTYFPFLSN